MGHNLIIFAVLMADGLVSGFVCFIFSVNPVGNYPYVDTGVCLFQVRRGDAEVYGSDELYMGH